MTAGERWVDVGAVGDLPPGTLHPVDVDGTPLLLINTLTGLHAVGAECTHEQAALADGELDATSITCPLHFSRFSVSDGAPLDPPADEPLAVHPVLVRDGRILIRTTPA